MANKYVNEYVKINSYYYVYAEYEQNPQNDEGDFYDFDSPEEVLSKMASLLDDGASWVCARLYARADEGERFARPKGYYDLDKWSSMTETVYAKLGPDGISYSKIGLFGAAIELSKEQALSTLLG